MPAIVHDGNAHSPVVLKRFSLSGCRYFFNIAEL
jgi:hypothetical protein